MSKQYIVGCKKLDTEGRGIVTFNGKEFAVPFLLDGEKAKISLVYGKNETGARLEEVLTQSPERVKPACPYFTKCGGCDLMHMTYEKQLQVKENHVAQVLKKRIESDKPTVARIVGAEEPLGYRNKIHNTYSKEKGRVVSGLYEENTHKLQALHGCLIEDPGAAAILETIVAFANEKKIKVYDENRRTGVLRHVLIRIAQNGDTMVVPVIADNIFPEKRALVELLVKKHPQVRTVVLNYNSAATTMVLGKREEILYGEGYITETICGCSFRISPKSFFQVNTVQAEKLFDLAVSMADLKPGERAIDAYSGTGTIGIIAASRQKEAHVIGVELNADAVRDAKSNAERNHITNTEWICGDAGEFLKASATAGSKVDVIFLDPPRSGSSPEFLKAINRLRPNRLVYISCNPDTLARDLELLGKGYRLERVCPVELFPQTGHVETVILMSRKDK